MPHTQCAGCRLDLPQKVHHLGPHGCKRIAEDTDENIFTKYGAVPFLTPIRLKLPKADLYEQYGPLPFFINKRTPPEKCSKPEWLNEFECIAEEINTIYFERLSQPKKKQIFKRLDEIPEEDDGMTSTESEGDSQSHDDSSNYDSDSVSGSESSESSLSSLENDDKARVARLFDAAMLHLGLEFRDANKTINPFTEQAQQPAPPIELDNEVRGGDVITTTKSFF